MLFALADYPVHGLNWAATSPSNPSLSEAAARISGKLLIGGIERDALVAPADERALPEARRSAAEMAGKPWVLGPSCSISTESRPESIQAVREFVVGGG